jgi:hypothetical protein
LKLVDTTITAGDRVYYSEHGAGKSIEVFRGRTAEVEFDDDGSKLPVSFSNLSKEVRCLPSGICEGDKVHASYGDYTFVGDTVKELFSNGIVIIHDDHFSGNIGSTRFVYEPTNFVLDSTKNPIGKSVQCYDGICVKSRVDDTDLGKVGVTQMMFSDGVATVQFDGDSNLTLVTTTSLSAQLK